jgi:hemerythrin-like domain-containing protein
MAHDATARPPFQVLRSIVRYIDEYPEQLHHPKEDEHLFARLLARAPEARLLVEELQAEHEEGGRLIRELERALLLLEEGWPARAREFQQAVDAYAEFHWKHMRKEEQQLLPLAERHLLPEDWRAISTSCSAASSAWRRSRSASAIAGREPSFSGPRGRLICIKGQRREAPTVGACTHTS